MLEKLTTNHTDHHEQEESRILDTTGSCAVRRTAVRAVRG